MHVAFSCRAQLSACCCQSVELRPSMRELRIALLDLLASTSATGAALTSHDFDRKWEQLMPRQPATVVDTRSHGDSMSRQLFATHDDVTPDNNATQPAEQLETAEQQRDTPNDAREAADEDELHIITHTQPQPAVSSLDSRLTDDIIILDSAGDKVARSNEAAQQQLESFVSPIVTTDSRNANKSVVVDSGLLTSTPLRPSTQQVDSSAEQTPAEGGAVASETQSSLYRTAFAGASTESFGANDLYLTTNQSLQPPAPRDSRASSASSMTSLSAANSTTEDRSILGPKKFAAMLQTVATSVDDESGSWSMDNTATSFDALSFDVIQEEDDADDVSGDAIGDNVLTRRDEVFAAGNDGSSATADASQSDEHQRDIEGNPKISVSNADEQENFDEDDDDIMVIES